MKRVIMVRHGETDWNREDRIQGGLDIPLNKWGKQQSRDIATRLATVPIDRIYSSRLSRAYETALEIARLHNLEVLVNSRLNELGQGEWEGMRSEEVKRAYPDLYLKWEKDPTLATPPGGENVRQAFQRVQKFCKEKILHGEGTDLVVANNVINALIKLILRDENSLGLLWEKLPHNAQIERFIL